MGIIFVNSVPTYHIGRTSAFGITKNKRLICWNVSVPTILKNAVPLSEIMLPTIRESILLPVGLLDQLNHLWHFFSHKCNTANSLQIHGHAFFKISNHVRVKSDIRGNLWSSC